jgi:hypothetical protein
MDIKKILDRRQAFNKKGTLTDGEIKSLVKEWHDKRAEEDLSTLTVVMEMKAMEKKLTKYNMEQLGEIPTVREDGTMRVLVSQMGGCASMETRQLKIAATEQLIRKYNINVCAFMELNFNWSKVLDTGSEGGLYCTRTAFSQRSTGQTSQTKSQRQDS